MGHLLLILLKYEEFPEQLFIEIFRKEVSFAYERMGMKWHQEGKNYLQQIKEQNL